MTDAPDPESRKPGANGCGCFAAIAFFVLAAFPALIFAGMQGGSCEGGPCHPERVVSASTALAWLAGAAALFGLAVRAFVGWAQKRGGGEGGRPPAWAAVVAAAIGLLVLLAYFVVIG